MARKRKFWKADPGESVELPQNDAGLNFVYWIALPGAVGATFAGIPGALAGAAAGLAGRVMIGIVGAKRVDQDLAGRGVYDMEYADPDVLEEVVDEWGERFVNRGR